MTKVCRSKQCSRAGEELSLTEYPRNKRYEDGIHPYCKECCRRQVSESRAKIRAMRQAQSLFGVERKPMRRSLSRDPLVEVYDAIARGRRTRETIQRSTHLTYDDIGDVLLQLVWEFRAVRIQNREFVLITDQKAVAA